MLIKISSKKLKRQFPQFSEEIDQLVSSGVKPKYLPWSIKQLQNGHSLNDIIPTLKYFERNTQKFPEDKRDINKFEDLKELEDLVKEIALKPRREVEVKDSEAVKLFENEKYVLVRPDTKIASCELGKGTQWCITSQDIPHWERYQSQNVVFYFLFDKTLPSKDSFYKVAFAVQRDLNNKVLDIQAFDATDTQYEPEKVPGYNLVKDKIKFNAESIPANIIVYAKEGLLSLEEFNYFWELNKDEGLDLDINEFPGKYDILFEPQRFREFETPEQQIQALKDPMYDWSLKEDIIKQTESKKVIDFFINNDDFFSYLLRTFDFLHLIKRSNLHEYFYVKVYNKLLDIIKNTSDTETNYYKNVSKNLKQLLESSIAPKEVLNDAFEKGIGIIQIILSPNSSEKMQLEALEKEKMGIDILEELALRSEYDSVLRKLMSFNKETIDIEIAKNLFASSEILRDLASKSSSNYVLRAIASNYNTPFDILKELYEHGPDIVSRQAEKEIERRKREEPIEKIKYKIKQEDKTIDDLSEKEIVELLGYDINHSANIFSAEKLTELSKSNSIPIRLVVLRHPKTPLEVIENLMHNDPELVIQQEASSILRSRKPVQTKKLPHREFPKKEITNLKYIALHGTEEQMLNLLDEEPHEDEILELMARNTKLPYKVQSKLTEIAIEYAKNINDDLLHILLDNEVVHPDIKSYIHQYFGSIETEAFKLLHLATFYKIAVN